MKLSRAVALRISEILEERNITQYRLEKLTLLHHNTISCIMLERNKSINLKTLMIIMNALEITPKDFFDSPLFTNEDLELE